MIRKQGYATYVPANTKCASACALIWIAGSSLSTATTGSVGFHAAYVYVDGKPMEKGLGNALVGAYLSKLGLSYAAIAFATAAGPNEISWLSPVVAKDIGITYFSQIDEIVTVRTADTVTPVSAPASPAPAVVAPQQTAPVALITAPLDFHARTWPQIADQYIAAQPDVDFGSCSQQQVIRALQITTFGQPVWSWAEVGCSPSKRNQTQAGPVQLPADFVQLTERFVVQHSDWDFTGCTRRTLATAMVTGSFGKSTGCMPKLVSSAHAG